MKIEFKSDSFRRLCNWLDCRQKSDDWIFNKKIKEIYLKEMKPQFEKAFLKYQNQKQKFKLKEHIQFRWPRDEHWWNGTIHKVSRLANGQYKYIIRYLEPADDWHHDINQIDGKGNGINYTNPTVEKNIRKL